MVETYLFTRRIKCLEQLVFFENLYYRLSLFTKVGWQSAITSAMTAGTCGMSSYSWFEGNPAKVLGLSTVCGAGTVVVIALTDTAALYYFPVDVPNFNKTQTTGTTSPSPSSSYLPNNNYPEVFPTATVSPIPVSYSSSPLYSAEPSVMGTTATPAPGFSPEIEN